MTNLHTTSSLVAALVDKHNFSAILENSSESLCFCSMGPERRRQKHHQCTEPCHREAVYLLTGAQPGAVQSFNFNNSKTLFWTGATTEPSRDVLLWSRWAGCGG